MAEAANNLWVAQISRHRPLAAFATALLPTACAELRQCIQHCYALSLSRRYNKTKDAASQHLANK